jgi:hypothetical protein
MPIENIGGILVNVVLVAILAGVVIWQIAASRGGEKARTRGAGARGWGYQKVTIPNTARYIFSGQTADGIPWQMEGVRSKTKLSSGSSTTITYTRWYTDAISHPDHAVLIGPRPGDMPGGLAFGGSLAQHFLRLLMRGMPDVEPGDEARLSGLKEVQVGTETFGRSYAVFATDETVARGLLGGDVESVLIDWAMREKRGKNLPMIVYWQRGLQIRLDDNFSANMGVLDRLTTLGEALTQRKM